MFVLNFQLNLKSLNVCILNVDGSFPFSLLKIPYLTFFSLCKRELAEILLAYL